MFYPTSKRRRLAFIISFCLLFFLSVAVEHCFAVLQLQNEEPQPPQADILDKSLWVRFKGRAAKDAVLLGMWSLHMDGSGEFLGRHYNEQNHMFGLQYSGFAFATFVNSHYDRTFFAGLSREFYSVSYKDEVRMDAGYHIGLMHGYKDNLPNIFGISPQLMFKLGVTWSRIGFDLGWSPLIVATFNFRIDL